MFGKKGKPIKRGDQPITEKGAVKGPHAPAKGVNATASKPPKGTGGNKNLPR